MSQASTEDGRHHHDREHNATTPELKALLGQFSDEEIETGVVAITASDEDLSAAELQAVLVEASLGRLVSTARAQEGVSLAELGRRLGVSKASIHKLEKPGANPQVRTLYRVADALGYDVVVTFRPRKDDRKAAVPH